MRSAITIFFAVFLFSVSKADTPEKRTVDYGGFSREYLLYTPQNSSAPKGILICLHGFNSSMNNFFQDLNITEIADSLNLLIIAPQALPEQSAEVIEDAKNLERNYGQSIPLDAVWGCGLKVKITLLSFLPVLDDELNRNIDDTGFINQLINNTLSEYSLSGDNIFMLGTSMGAYMTYQYALQHGDRLAGIIPIAGTMGTAIRGRENATALPVCDFHSLSDEVVPYSGVSGNSLLSITLGENKEDVIKFWVNLNGAASAQIEDFPELKKISVRKYTYFHTKNEVIHYQMSGAPHAYFFSKANGDAMDYIEESIKFMVKHSVSGSNSIDTPVRGDLVFYPNPVENIIHFTADNGYFSIYDLMGKKCFSGEFKSAHAYISGLQAGVYIIVVQTGGREYRAKLVLRQ